MDFLFEQFAFKLRSIAVEQKRFLYETIDWSRNPVIIKGTRGIGKTQLALQFVKLNFKIDHQVLFVSANHIYFSQNSIEMLANNFVKKGGKLLLIDDIHKYKNWQEEIERVLKKFNTLKLILIGHALDDYQSSEYIRQKAAIYDLPGLSLREYIAFSNGKSFEPLDLEDILTRHAELASEITNELDPTAYLNPYLKYGYYPFFMENRSNYVELIQQSVTAFLESDLTFLKSVDFKNLSKIKQLLGFIAVRSSMRPNITELSELIGATRGTLLQYLDYLKTAGILHLIKKDNQEESVMTKPDRISIANPNLAALLQADERLLRKTFLMNQLSVGHGINFSEQADFEITGTKFESISKLNASINKIDSNATIHAVDTLEIGVNNQIPLWIFGFMY
jgi:uncharacterized protein